MGVHIYTDTTLLWHGFRVEELEPVVLSVASEITDYCLSFPGAGPKRVKPVKQPRRGYEVLDPGLIEGQDESIPYFDDTPPPFPNSPSLPPSALRECEVDSFLDDCFWENQCINTFLICTTPILTCVETVVRPAKRRRVPVIGGAGDCWRKVFQVSDHITEMTMVEFMDMCDSYNSFCGGDSNWWLDITFDGSDFHLANAVLWMPRLQVYSTWDCELADPPVGFTHMADVRQVLADLVEEAALIGTQPPVLSPVARQLPDVFDMSLDPTLFATSKQALNKLASWYWKHAVHHPGIQPKPVFPIDPGLDPGPHLLPGLPNSPPNPLAPGNTDNLTHIYTPLEMLTKQLLALCEEGMEHLKQAYETVVHKLESWGIFLDAPAKFLLLNFRHFCSLFAEKTSEWARYAFNHFGLAFLVPAVGDVAHFVASFVRDIVNMSYNVLDYGFLGLKILFFLTQDFTEWHGPDHVYKRALVAGELDLVEAEQCVIESQVSTGREVFRTLLPERLLHLAQQTGQLTASNAAETAVVAAARDKVVATIDNLNRLPTIVLPESTDVADVAQFQAAFPEFLVDRGVNAQPHARLAAVRRAFRVRANQHLSGRGKPVRAVGASNTEMPTINRLVHNCWPTDSGRTERRKRTHCSPGNAAVRAFTHDHRFEHCDHGTGVNSVLGADVWAFFSAHDIHPETFIREMASSGSDTAVVAMHLPFPLLDRRVKSYDDHIIGLRYEVVEDKLLVYHLSADSAGYSHDFETVYAWMQCMPHFTNAHVQLEVLSQLGTAVLLELSIGKGEQEIVPSIWSCQQEDFYILPELLGPDLRQGERPHFAIPARKFEQVTAYIATLNDVDLTPQNVVSKLRGMLAEIRVGVHTVEPRWAVTFPQLYSLVHHALWAHRLHSRSTKIGADRLESYYSRVAWRSGNFFQRFVQYRLDLLTFRAGGETQPLDDSCWRWLFSNRFDHKQTYNPYQRAGKYRLANIEVRHSNRLNKALEYKSVKSFGSRAFWFTVAAAGVTGSAGARLATAAASAVAKPFTDHWALMNRPRDTPDLGKPVEAPLPPSEFQPFVGTVPNTPVQPPAALGCKLYSRRRASFDSLYDVSDVSSVPPASPATAPSAATDPDVPVLDLYAAVEAAAPSPPPSPPPRKLTPPPRTYAWSSPSSETTPEPSPLPSPVVVPETPVVDEGDDIDEWYQVHGKSGDLLALPSHVIPDAAPRAMDFLAPITPVSREHPADDVVAGLLGPRTRFAWPAAPLIVPCPTKGATSLIDSATESHGNHFPVTILPKLKGVNVRQVVNAFSVGLDESEPEKATALRNKFNRFADHTVKAKGALPVKLLAIDGPARSAKSTLARLYVTSRLKTALVYVPSAKLKEQWSSDPNFRQAAEVMTRHSVPRRQGGYDIGIVDEVFNFAPFELELHIRVLRRAGCTTVLLIGDRYQREQGGIPPDHAYLSSCIQLHTSLGMPRDAHFLYCRLNNLSDWYTTTGTLEHSVFFSDSVDLPNADISFGMHQHAAGGDVLTIGKVQGARADTAVFRADNPLKQAGWVHNNASRLSVAFTRHSRLLIVYCDGNVARSYTDPVPLQRYYIVGSRRPDLEHTLHPRVADDLVVPISSTKFDKRAAKLRAVMSSPLVAEGHAVVVPDPDPEAPERVALTTFTRRSELLEFVDTMTNFELPDPSDRDLVTAQPRRKVKFTPPGPPVQRDDVRNDLPRSHLLAAIQVNSSGFDSFKNLVDRQVATTKSARFGTADMQEGEKIYRRFAECFYGETATLLHTEKAVSWLVETELNALNEIACSTLGDGPHALSVAAEFKTQTKAKAQPSFAATLPYGQSILANSKAFNAFFADDQPLLYLNAAKLLRSNVIMDYGYSDEELSRRLQVLGVAADMNGPLNIQADVSKQDSSHTAAFLYAFLLVAKDCGLSEQKLLFYLAYVRQYAFKSRGSDHTSSSVSFNLGSGDPFTLIRNDIMEMCVIACRYADAKTMTIVEKGDDVHGVIASRTAHPYARLPSISSVKLTVDFGIVGYHAGRFHNGCRYLVDPVRAFLKHFTRLSDSNVTNDILYGSYVSRATDYSEAEADFLLAACQVHYPYYSSDHISMMIRTMLSLRERKEFEKWSVVKLKPFTVSVDAESDCAANCVRAVAPGRSKQFYNQFRNLSQRYLVQLLLDHGIEAVAFSPGMSVARGVIAVSHNHARVEVDIGAFNPLPDPFAATDHVCPRRVRRPRCPQPGSLRGASPRH
nr:MAG: polyprotein [Leptosphaeria biglobosa flavi-like virus 1]